MFFKQSRDMHIGPFNSLFVARPFVWLPSLSFLVLLFLSIVIGGVCGGCADKTLSPEELGMAFVYVQPGTFMMGSPEIEPGRDDDEQQHQVTLTRGFYLQTTEVTQGQWQAVMGNNPSAFQNCGDNCPVEQVSWKDTQRFIQQLNQMTGKEFRLPTEAEWEYACRAGTTTPFNTGDCLSTDKANYDGSHPLPDCPPGQLRNTTLPVKTFAPNAWGLYDMHGSVFEWCADRYGDYPSESVVDPVGDLSQRDRTARGGSWVNYARFGRSANRARISPSIRISYLGFRLAFSSPGD